MGAVQAAAACGHRGHRLDLVRRRVVARPIFKPGGQADRAVVKSLFSQPTHFSQTALTRRTTQRAMAHKGRHIDRRARLLQAIQVVAEAAPVQCNARLQMAKNLAGVGPRAHGRGAEAALADDLGRHALADLAVGAAVHQQGEIGVGVDVDEAGRDHQAAGIQALRGRGALQIADGHDAVTHDAQVAGKGVAAAAVDDVAAVDQGVEHGAPACVYSGAVSASRMTPAIARQSSCVNDRGRRRSHRLASTRSALGSDCGWLK